MDHLMGKVFVEYLSPLKRNRIKTKLMKEDRAQRESGPKIAGRRG
jgi:peptide deformylase